MVDVANLRLHLKIEWIESLGFLQLDECQIVAFFEQREPPGIPQMRGRRSWTELERARERLFRATSIPVVIHSNQAANFVRLREVRIEFERFVDGPPRVGHRLVSRQDSQT